MKPLSLYIEGINSFTDGQTVDFEAAGRDNIFCISGSTGSGKTTVLDAMILALYPNHSERGLLSDYINLRCERGVIVFRFELDGEIYETTRVLSRKTNKNSFVLRLRGEAIAEGNDAFSLIESKIGLSAADFTHVVVLQQGAFAKFLKAKKSERIALISRLFRLERFDKLGSKFGAKKTALEGEIAACDSVIDAFSHATAEALKQLNEDKAACESELALLKKRADGARAEAEKISALYAEYAKQAVLKKEIEQLAAVERENGESLKKGEQFVFELNKTEGELIKREGGKDALLARRAEIRQALSLLSELEKKQALLSRDERENERLFTVAAKAKEQAERDEKALSLLDESIRSAQAQNAVAAIKSVLTDGDECPICGGTYRCKTHFSAQSEDGGELIKMQQERKALQLQTEKSRAEAAALTGRAEAAKKQIEKSRAEYALEQKSLTEKVGADGEKTLAAIERELSEIADERAKINDKKRRADERLLALRSSLATAQAALAAKRALIKDAQPVSEADYLAARTAADALSSEVMEKSARLGALTSALEKTRIDCEKRLAAQKRRTEIKKQYDRYALLASLFYRNGFSEFVAAEFVKDFTVAASAQLGRLTGGKYSLTYEEGDGDKTDFAIYDFLSGNEKRSVKTLSGGETFLASLSLAIAISQELSASKAFNFFFIDEGFGTLSPDAIDLVVAALETLSADCLVGVITHRSELIERIPSVIEVTPATEDDGSRIRLR